MLEVLVNFANCFITAILGFYIINILTKTNISLKRSKTILLLFLGSIAIMMFQEIKYPEIKPLLIYCINIIIYKKIFNFHIDDAIIVVGIAMLLSLIGDILISIVISLLMINNTEVVNNIITVSIKNSIVLIITMIIITIPKVKNKLCDFYYNIKNKKKISTVIFFSLTIIISSILGFHISQNIEFDFSYIVTLIAIFILGILVIIFINSRNEYNNLVTEYDLLFTYIQNFEEWIEKEQLNRHEYKNQLAVLRCLTKEKKVKE